MFASYRELINEAAWRARGGPRAAPVPMERNDRFSAYSAAQGGACGICREALSGRLDWDHVIPRRFGGERPGNVLLVHRLCNARKAGRWPTTEELTMLASVNAALAQGIVTEGGDASAAPVSEAN